MYFHTKTLKSEWNNSSYKPWFHILLQLVTIHCGYQKMVSVFRVLGMYNFGKCMYNFPWHFRYQKITHVAKLFHSKVITIIIISSKYSLGPRHSVLSEVDRSWIFTKGRSHWTNSPIIKIKCWKTFKFSIHLCNFSWNVKWFLKYLILPLPIVGVPLIVGCLGIEHVLKLRFWKMFQQHGHFQNKTYSHFQNKKYATWFAKTSGVKAEDRIDPLA